jgi:Transcriptional regulators
MTYATNDSRLSSRAPHTPNSAMPTKTSPLRDEIKQTRPFTSPASEAVVSILRTAAVVQRHLSQVVEAGGITIQQYNVLRILRGAGNVGLPTLAIRDRMIEEAAGITRLLDKLETAGFVLRERSTPDRRQVLCHITPAGFACSRSSTSRSTPRTNVPSRCSTTPRKPRSRSCSARCARECRRPGTDGLQPPARST